MSTIRSAWDVMDGDLVLYEGELWVAIGDAELDDIDSDFVIIPIRNDSGSTVVEWRIGSADEVVCE